MTNIRDYYNKKRKKNANRLGLTPEEVYVNDTALDCLCFFNPKINPSYFDPQRKTCELFNYDRALFGRFFSSLVYELDCLTAIKSEEIPIGVEFERFPQFIDLVEFFYIKYSSEYT
jgi:hypothetical protein